MSYHTNTTAIRMLRVLFDGPEDITRLAGMPGRGERQLANVARHRGERGYVAKKCRIITLAENYKTRILRDASRITNVETPLRGSNDGVLAHMAGGATIEEVAAGAGLSRASAYKSISGLRSVGAVTRRGDCDRRVKEGARDACRDSEGRD